MTDYSYNNQNDLRERVLGQIKKGDTRMKSRWRFVAASAALALAVVFFAGLLVGFTGLSAFLVRESGAWVATSFGPSGWLSFLRSIPAWHIAVFAVLILVLEYLLRSYRVVYRHPLIGSFVVVLALAVLGGAAVEPLHQEAARYIRSAHISQVLSLPYGTATRVSLAPDLFEGVVVEQRGDAIVIEREVSAGEGVDDDAEEVVATRTPAPAAPEEADEKKVMPVAAMRPPTAVRGDEERSEHDDEVVREEKDTSSQDDTWREAAYPPREKEEAEALSEKPRRTRKVRIVITPETRLPRGDTFEVGKTVIIQGRQTATDTIEAFGVRDFGDRNER